LNTRLIGSVAGNGAQDMGLGTGSAGAPLTLLVLCIVALVVSGLDPFDRITWLLEVAPVIIGLPILVLTHRSPVKTSSGGVGVVRIVAGLASARGQ